AGTTIAYFPDSQQAKALLEGALIDQARIRRIFIDASSLEEPEEFCCWLRNLNPHVPLQLILIGTITATRLMTQSARDQFDEILTWPISPSVLRNLNTPGKPIETIAEVTKSRKSV